MVQEHLVTALQPQVPLKMLTSSSAHISSSPFYFKTSTSPPPRLRIRPPIAAATTTTAYSYTSTRNTTSTSTLTSTHPMASCASSLYEVLGIPMGATSQEIKTAYRQLARTCHPDVAAIERKDSSADDFIKIHAAYSTLSDPQKRAVYDQKLFRRRRPLTAASGYSSYSGRNWETDQCW